MALSASLSRGGRGEQRKLKGVTGHNQARPIRTYRLGLSNARNVALHHVTLFTERTRQLATNSACTDLLFLLEPLAPILANAAM